MLAFVRSGKDGVLPRVLANCFGWDEAGLEQRQAKENGEKAVKAEETV